MKDLRVRLCAVVVAAMIAAAPGFSDQKDKEANRSGVPGGRSEDRITREVRHELVMLPYYNIFDNLAYRVDGDTVTLYGQVVRPTLKNDAEKAVKIVPDCPLALWSKAGAIEMKVNEMPASVPSRAARGVYLRMVGPTKAPSNTMVPIRNAQASPDSQASTGSLVLR